MQAGKLWASRLRHLLLSQKQLSLLSLLRTMKILILLVQSVLVVVESGLYEEYQCGENERPLKVVVEEIIEEIAQQTNCIVFATDSGYRRLVDIKRINGLSSLLKYEIALRDNEQFSQPRKRVQKILIDSKKIGCNAYIILIANGLLTSKFVRYAERQRLINTRGFFLLLYDYRLLKPNLHYLWNRIINVIFVRRYNAYKRRSGERALKERIDLDTVYFPQRKNTFTLTKYIDTWYRGKFRYGGNHFIDKTTNLQGKQLRVAVFEHIPAVTETSRVYYDGHLSNNSAALGVEFELMQIVAKAMNFKPMYYMPYNIATEKWGTKSENESYTGLLRETFEGNAAFFLGDLHYTIHHLNYFDLTIPYNTECLTFLTPESLTENSWKLLILPFKLYTWIALLLSLLLGGAIFYFLSFSYKKHISLYKREQILNLDIREETRGLYLFTEIQNSILYSYGMLLQVSLPKLPNPWALRVLIGWWWIYSILVAVAYRASMTATLANPVARVSIDTLAQLAKTSIEIGGWSEESKYFFLMSSDPNSQEIGNKFQLTEFEDDAVARVANGSFCYYENINLLRHAKVKRQLLEKEQKDNKTFEDSLVKYNLHIMEECVVNMPIALGMEKNSALKPNVDTWVRRIIEVGLVEKWLSDVMEWSKINGIRQESESGKALVNLRKLQGAFVAIGVGYLLSFLTFIGEILYWKYIVLRNPKYDKYHLDLFYNINNFKNQKN